MGNNLREPRVGLSQDGVRMPFFDIVGISLIYPNRRLAEAKRHYLKVLEIDSRHSAALAFLGMVHHLMDQPDQAIIRYHEV